MTEKKRKLELAYYVRTTAGERDERKDGDYYLKKFKKKQQKCMEQRYKKQGWRYSFNKSSSHENLKNVRIGQFLIFFN